MPYIRHAFLFPIIDPLKIQYLFYLESISTKLRHTKMRCQFIVTLKDLPKFTTYEISISVSDN